MCPHVVEVNEQDFASAVIDRSHQVPVVVDFWAEWCGPCRVLGPTLERLAGESEGQWVLAKIDVDRNQALARQFGVQGIPTVVAFRDGRAVNRFTGALGEPQVRDFIGSVVPSELDMDAAAAELALDRGEVDTAEQGFRSVLARDPAHEVAGIGLASILVERLDTEEALEVLAKLGRSDAVRRMEAAARLTAPAADLTLLKSAAAEGTDADRLEYAKAVAANGDPEAALDVLMELVADPGEHADEARLVTLDLFELLGNDHALVSTYRRRLASALF